MDPMTAVTLLLGLLDRAGQIGVLIQKAQAEKRDITDAELDQLVEIDNQARKALQDAIAAVRGG